MDAGVNSSAERATIESLSAEFEELSDAFYFKRSAAARTHFATSSHLTNISILCAPVYVRKAPNWIDDSGLFVRNMLNSQDKLSETCRILSRWCCISRTFAPDDEARYPLRTRVA